MAISRERAVELSHRIGERLASTAGVSVLAEREFTRNRVLQALLEWDRELGLLEGRARTRIRERNRRVVEGTQEWDLLFAEEMSRALDELLGRGE
jgi:hypothetical protein